jgi:hypothetical protein
MIQSGVIWWATIRAASPSRSTARARWATAIAVRRSVRSIRTPPNGPTNSSGANVATVSSAIWRTSAVTLLARRGSATRRMPSPRLVAVDALHSSQNR